jgi:TRAP-type mannitol/chloroaromatic compound transport system permease small subunit
MASTSAGGPDIELMDESLAERRVIGAMPPDMPPWMARTIRVIDGFSDIVARIVCWLVVPLMFGMVYEVVARKLFTAPTIWAFDISRMLYGAHFMLGAAYVLSKGLHIRSDFLYRDWAVRTQARVDILAYIVFFFPTMLLFLWVSADYAWASIDQMERSTETAWMPLLGPVKTCIPFAAAFLLLQGVSELLKCLYALRTGRWAHERT